ncbi:MAG: zinc finger-like domain-containing protein [Prevotellaceae bacterium]|jgi:DnaJ-class molecular chaperone|nr:zinc finger-like domain-containing protein [Prevotellaceae bacterium]
MSLILEHIAIDPQRISELHHTETLHSRAYACPVCHGRGYALPDVWDKDGKNKTCRFCEGSGKIAATITIEWEKL